MKVIVFHRGYGCDTGCCGHAIKIDGKEVVDSFEFSHPWDDQMPAAREWAEAFVRDHFGDDKHIADLDWENCVVVDD